MMRKVVRLGLLKPIDLLFHTLISTNVEKRNLKQKVAFDFVLNAVGLKIDIILSWFVLL